MCLEDTKHGRTTIGMSCSVNILEIVPFIEFFFSFLISLTQDLELEKHNWKRIS